MADSIDAASFRIDDYDYDLPPELIAQLPAPSRESSRLLVLDRARQRVAHRWFRDLSEYLVPGDVLVVNDTRVVPARLHGVKETGGQVELLVLDPYKDNDNGAGDGYECLIRSSKPARPGGRLLLNGGTEAVVVSEPHDGRVKVRFLGSEPVVEMLDRIGHVPLPPYIRRAPEACGETDDARSYQTVYAARAGAVAAPTAGLHFTDELLESLHARGIERIAVTLHVGYGTFAPMRVSDIRDHVIHSEYVEISGQAVSSILNAKEEGRRVVAVGTTVVRALEWAAARSHGLAPIRGLCGHYIYPGYEFRIVDTMITNFHLPRSSLLLLVSAFAGRQTLLEAYRAAVQHRYRFFSYGDAMLLL